LRRLKPDPWNLSVNTGVGSNDGRTPLGSPYNEPFRQRKGSSFLKPRPVPQKTGAPLRAGPFAYSPETVVGRNTMNGTGTSGGRMYGTQLEAARKGVVTPELRGAARDEGIDEGRLMALVAAGKAVIPANRLHASLRPRAIGRELSTKINVNVGVSKDENDPELEFRKAAEAARLGAHAVMDLSVTGDTAPFRRRLVAESPLMVGTVPVYDAVARGGKALKSLVADDWIGALRAHAEDGVDFVTLHCGLSREAAAALREIPRLTGIVSRGGALLFAWMSMTGNENPYLERFDEVLSICAEYDVTLSLGDACRPGSIADSTDSAQIGELIRLGELARRARDRGVQVMIEGPGHMALDEITANVALERRLCDDAPFYVLGPLVTDSAPGWDHITAAIGGAVAAAAGAAFLCYVTPAEHLRLPTLADSREGLMASRIAAHAADIVKGIPGARERDDRMSRARAALDWQTMFGLALDGEKAREYRSGSPPEKEDTCTMCGPFCALKNVNAILKGEAVDVR